MTATSVLCIGKVRPLSHKLYFCNDNYRWKWCLFYDSTWKECVNQSSDNCRYNWERENSMPKYYTSMYFVSTISSLFIFLIINISGFRQPRTIDSKDNASNRWVHCCRISLFSSDDWCDLSCLWADIGRLNWTKSLFCTITLQTHWIRSWKSEISTKSIDLFMENDFYLNDHEHTPATDQTKFVDRKHFPMKRDQNL